MTEVHLTSVSCARVGPPGLEILDPSCMHADEASQTGEGVSWRQAPSDFGIGGRYPVKEVFSAAYEAWKGECHATQKLCHQL